MRTNTAYQETLPGAVLKAVIIYDDFDAAADATMLLERVATRADKAIKWDIKPWRCDVLKQPNLAALTIAVAANADLIVLALGRRHFPPAELLDWLKNWGKHRRIKDAAVLMLHTGADGQLSEAWSEIKALVESHHLTFLGSHRISANGSSAPPVNRLHSRKHPAAPVPLAASQPLAVNK